MIVFIDFKKAFDAVPHDILIKKLSHAGITGSFLTLLKSFLAERQQQVKVGNSTSPLRTMNFGVPQGSILSPTLFSIFINDLLSSTTFLQSHAYADDTVFYGSDSSTGILCRKAQNDINVINQWCIDNGMFINTNKSHFMITNTSETVDLLIGNSPLTQTSSSSLLGFVVNDRLTPTDHVSKLLKKVATNTRLLLAVRHLMNSHLSLKFYHHFIHSYLTYGSEIYFPLATSKQTTSLTILQKKALKYAISLPRRYPTRLLEHKSVLLLPKLAYYFSAILGYKVLNNSCPSYLSDLFKTTPSTSTIITRHTFKLPNSYYHSTLQKYTLTSFNNLPKSLRSAKSLKTFKKNLKTYLRNDN